MEQLNTTQPQSQTDFAFDLAAMALKGRRFTEAQDRFTDLASQTNSYIAWCGLAYSKLGLILENVTVEEVFYCFEKGRQSDTSGTNDTEKIAIQSTTDVIRNMFDLCADAESMITKAEKDKNRAMISAVVHTVFMMGSRIEGRSLDSLVSAGFSAVSYGSYLKAGASADELKDLIKRVTGIIDDLKAHLTAFVQSEKENLTLALEQIEKNRQEYLAISRPTIPLPMNTIKATKERTQDILADSTHEFHLRKADALRLTNLKKDKEALKSVNIGLQFVPDDPELLAAQKEIMTTLENGDWWLWLFPGVYALSLLHDRSSDNFMALCLVAGVVYGISKVRIKNRKTLGLPQ